MRRNFDIEATSSHSAQPSRGNSQARNAQPRNPHLTNPYPRVLMICGIALIAYGIIAPAGTLLRNIVQARSAVPDPPSANAAVSEVSKAEVTTSNAATSNAAASNAAATNTAASNAAEMKKQDEIMKLYAQWKDAWKRRDINALMKLYSPRVQFQLEGGPPADYARMRSTFLSLWSRGGYTVNDEEPPNLVIDARRAVLIVGQRYIFQSGYSPDAVFTSRYILEQEEQSGGRKQSNSATPLKTPLPYKSRQWRITGEEFLPYQGSNARTRQIY
ncbi:MAG TPA: hypothetical protein VF600_00525 [Abditibacteriaceae bacterium]|jgi:hypothetical protein